ncbi:MAG: ATP-binding protein [Bacteroidota bacterium]
MQLEKEIKNAKIFADSGRYDSAISILYKTMPKAKNRPELLAEIYLGLAQAHCYENSLDTGLKYYRLAHEKAVKVDNELLIGKALLGLGAVYYVIDSMSLAEEYLKKCLPILNKINDTLSLAYAYSNLGLLQSQKEALLNAERSFLQAMKYYVMLDDWHSIASTYYNLGLAKARANQSQLAIQYFNKCIDLSIEKDLKEDYSRALRAVAIEYFKLESYQKSSEYFSKYDSLGHSVFHQDSKEKILELETKYKTAKVEKENIRKQSKIFILYSTLGSVLIASLGIFLYMDQRKKRIKADSQRAVEISNQKIQDLLQNQEVKTAYALLEGQDNERKRIAAELHDNLGNILVTINMYADSLSTKVSDIELKEITKRISRTSSIANEEIRKISHSLDSGLLKHFGLKAAISQLIEAIQMSKSIEIQKNLCLEDHFTNERGLQLYRIIQELLNNSLKHSGCTSIVLDLTQIDNVLSVIYQDNGVGLNPSTYKKGMGLNNIQKRVKKIGGIMQIESFPKKGFTFTMEFTTT